MGNLDLDKARRMANNFGNCELSRTLLALIEEVLRLHRRAGTEYNPDLASVQAAADAAREEAQEYYRENEELRQQRRELRKDVGILLDALCKPDADLLWTVMAAIGKLQTMYARGECARRGEIDWLLACEEQNREAREALSRLYELRREWAEE
jgi:hypothetical protein